MTQEVTEKDIVFAKPEDVVQIVSLGYKSLEEGSLKKVTRGLSPDFDKTTQFVIDAVIHDVVLVKRDSDDERKIEGVLGCIKDNFSWWTNDEVLIGFLFFIKEDKRSFKLAKSFLKAIKEYAIMVDMPVVFDLLTDKDANRKKKLFKYCGFKEIGSLYLFDPNWEI